MYHFWFESVLSEAALGRRLQSYKDCLNPEGLEIICSSMILLDFTLNACLLWTFFCISLSIAIPHLPFTRKPHQMTICNTRNNWDKLSNSAASDGWHTGAFLQTNKKIKNIQWSFKKQCHQGYFGYVIQISKCSKHLSKRQRFQISGLCRIQVRCWMWQPP